MIKINHQYEVAVIVLLQVFNGTKCSNTYTKFVLMYGMVMHNTKWQLLLFLSLNIAFVLNLLSVPLQFIDYVLLILHYVVFKVYFPFNFNCVNKIKQ